MRCGGNGGGGCDWQNVPFLISSSFFYHTFPSISIIHLFIDLFLCVHCLRSFIKAGPILPLSFFPAFLASLPFPEPWQHTLLTGWFKGSITVQEMKLFHSSPLLLSSRSWWGPLLLQRHVGRDVSCVRSSSLLTCVWPFIPVAEGAAAFSIKWLVIWALEAWNWARYTLNFLPSVNS